MCFAPPGEGSLRAGREPSALCGCTEAIDCSTIDLRHAPAWHELHPGRPAVCRPASRRCVRPQRAFLLSPGPPAGQLAGGQRTWHTVCCPDPGRVAPACSRDSGSCDMHLIAVALPEEGEARFLPMGCCARLQESARLFVNGAPPGIESAAQARVRGCGWRTDWPVISTGPFSWLACLLSRVLPACFWVRTHAVPG
jgi:hypothetical protein